ncbi:hypothetical protein KDC22_24485 [Paenibacillus tritici]|uniref:hypothetical protein n=1 Tax=Paenibacillus tritici TaxID=1873425 RepID=UPI001BA99F4B|nr:hypothetical protein [Paenibacillus tritici]QUL53512.1 hypothetical protein KDC22_24485 [Paenibacillus tritici]
MLKRLVISDHHFGDALAIIHKELVEIMDGFRFPPLEDIRMNAVFAGQLRNRFLFFSISSMLAAR